MTFIHNLFSDNIPNFKKVIIDSSLLFAKYFFFICKQQITAADISGVARGGGQVGARAAGRTKKLFLYYFFDVFTQILETILWITVL